MVVVVFGCRLFIFALICCLLLLLWGRKCGSLVEYVSAGFVSMRGGLVVSVDIVGIVYRCAVVCDLRGVSLSAYCCYQVEERQQSLSHQATTNDVKRTKSALLGCRVGKWRMMMSGTGKHGGRRGTCRKVFDYCGQLTP